MSEAQEITPTLVRCPDVQNHCPECLKAEYETKTGLAIIDCQGVGIAHSTDHIHF